MQKFKTLSASRLVMFIGGAVLALGLIWPPMSTAQDKSDEAGDPTSHSQHNGKQSSGDPDLAGQIAELHAKVAKLEAALNQNSNGTPSDTPKQDGEAGTQEKTGRRAPSTRASAKFQNCIQCHQKRPSGPLPPSHLEMAGGNGNGTVEAGAADGQGSSGPGAGMKMKGQGMSGGKSKGMMDKGMGMGKGMMDKGMGMGGGKGMEMKGQGGQAMGGEGGIGDETEGMGGGAAEIGGSTPEAVDQQMKQMQQQMQHMQQQMQQLMQMQTLQMKVMEMQMKMREMK